MQDIIMNLFILIIFYNLNVLLAYWRSTNMAIMIIKIHGFRGLLRYRNFINSLARKPLFRKFVKIIQSKSFCRCPYNK